MYIVEMLNPLDNTSWPEHELTGNESQQGMLRECGNVIKPDPSLGHTPSSRGSWVHTPSEIASTSSIAADANVISFYTGGLCTPEVDPAELAILLNQHARVSSREPAAGHSHGSSQSNSPASSGHVTPHSRGSSLHSSRSASPDVRPPSRSPSPNEGNTDITRDPDFFDAEELPGPTAAAAEDDDGDSPDRDTTNPIPRALSEHSWIRKCYVSAFIQHMYHRATDDAISVQLKLDRAHLLDVREKTGLAIAGLDKMAVTRLAAERRLGLDPDEHIIFELSCSACWEPYPLCDLNDLASPDCTQPGCDGTIYKLRDVSDGRTKRVPCRIVSRSPLIPTLARMLQRPGKPKEYNSWRRGDEDMPGAVPPLAAPPGDGEDAYPHKDYRIHDITDAWGFRAIPAFLERQRGPEHGHWEFRDVNVNNHAQRFVALPNGLVFIINMDWYVLPCSCGTALTSSYRFQPMKRSAFGSHSTGVVFATVVNNPNPIRFHPREMFFLVAVPGPTEPDAVATSKLLDMVVDEFQKLYGGRIPTMCSTNPF